MGLKYIIAAIVFVLLNGVYVGAGLYLYNVTLKNAAESRLTNETNINLLKQKFGTFENMSGNVSFKSPKEFEQKVYQVINSYILENSNQKISAHLEKYNLADENSREPIYGNESARFTLVEYSDLECPYCRAYTATPIGLVNDNPEYLNLRFQHFPLSFHDPVASHQAHAVECVGELAGNRAYWAFIKSIFENTKGNGAGVASVNSIASTVGVSSEDLDECMLTRKYVQRIQAQQAQGRDFGVSSTPTTVIVDNLTGKSKMLQGVQSREALLNVINQMAGQG